LISHLVILVTVLLSLGAGPAEAGRKAPALSELLQAVAQNPQDPQAHYSLGLKYESLGKTKKAMGEYNKALSLKPDDEKVLYSLGRLLGELGQSEQAIKLMQKALKLKPNFAEARSLLAATYGKQGVALMEQGNLNAAREAFEAGIQTKGGAADTEALRNNLGCLYVRENRLDQAIGTFQELLQQNPNVAQARYNLALLYYTQGDYQAASRQMFALKGIDRDLAGELADYRFRIRTSTDWTPPVKTMLTFPGSPLLTQGSIPADFR
jgi:tetratricopeptide (TPR) repeat protein